ncbi:MAG: LemA protein [Cyclobacteriaceae bacterium]|jgi:LemA protein
MTGLIIAGSIAFITILWAVTTINSLIGKRNQVENAFASIDVMLKKRHDLIPNLVSSVKSFAKHEKELLSNITALRSQAMGASTSNEKIGIENQLTGMLGQLRVSMEAYPELKSDKNYLQLQASLNETEEQISAARRSFNASVNDYNNKVEMFPSSIIAGMRNMSRKASFEAMEAERQNVNVGDLLA